MNLARPPLPSPFYFFLTFSVKKYGWDEPPPPQIHKKNQFFIHCSRPPPPPMWNFFHNQSRFLTLTAPLGTKVLCVLNFTSSVV